MDIPANPVLNVRKPKTSKGRERRLEEDEEQRLFSACESYNNPMLAWIVKLALYTGMRHGETVSLTRSNVNLEKKTLFLSDTKNGTPRTVPLSNKAVLVKPTQIEEANFIQYVKSGGEIASNSLDEIFSV